MLLLRLWPPMLLLLLPPLLLLRLLSYTREQQRLPPPEDPASPRGSWYNDEIIEAHSHLLRREQPKINGVMHNNDVITDPKFIRTGRGINNRMDNKVRDAVARSNTQGQAQQHLHTISGQR